MRHWQLLASGVDTMPLMAEIARQPELWHEDTFLRHYPQGPFGDTDSIMLRFPAQVKVKSDKVRQRYVDNKVAGYDAHDSVFYPPWYRLPAAQNHVFALMQVLKGVRLGRVLINRIRPGGEIFPHRDHHIHTSRWRRHHLVLHGHPGAHLFIGDQESGVEVVSMQTGMLFWFDNREEHRVINNSDDDRISMVIDIQTCDVVV